jgi:Uma2 family endonuclease
MATAAQEWTPEQYVQLLSAIDFREIFVDGTLFPEVGKYSERNKQFIVEGVRRNNG